MIKDPEMRSRAAQQLADEILADWTRGDDPDVASRVLECVDAHLADGKTGDEIREILHKHGTRVSIPQQPKRHPLPEEEDEANEVRERAIDSMPYLRCVDGRRVPVLSRAHNLADIQSTRSSLTLGDVGNALVGIATGRASQYRAEIRALSEGVATAGGVMVQDEVSAMLIDAARAKSRMIEAGMSTIAMPSETLRIARLVSDPSYSVVAENALISESDPVFDAVNLTARKIATIVPASRELLDDASNAGQLLIEVLATSMASEIDRLALEGDGGSTDSILGLAYEPNVTVTDASTGSLSYDDILALMRDVRANNFDPKTLIMASDKYYDLSILKTATELQYLAPPADWANLQKLDTNKLTDIALCGDFSKALLGVRQDIAIDFSDVAGTYFAKHQRAFKVVWRGAFALMQPKAFARLEGIS